MVAIKALTVLAVAGTISAAPTATVGEALVRREAWNGNWRGNWSWSWGRPHQGGDDSQPAAQPSATPAASSSVPVADQTPPQDTGDSSTPSAPASSPSAAPSAAPSSGGSSGDSGYMAIVNQYRGIMGKSALTESSQLQANAQKTADDSGGQLKHELNPGSMAQVLAPGDASNFESVFVGGWLCEVPSYLGSDSSICNSMSQGWNHAGQTGHADILSSDGYHNIGCALGDGIWACDLS
jgi:hypothetical protein